ncbi:hypothetical protein ACSBR2_030918 [Camellia fascicularis]
MSACMWLTTSDNLLITIQEKIKWADSMSEVDKKHRKEVEERVDEAKKSIFLKMALLRELVDNPYSCVEKNFHFYIELI